MRSVTFRPARPEKIWPLSALSQTRFSLESRRLALRDRLSEIDDCCEGNLSARAAVTYAERWHGFHLAALPRRTISSLGSCSRHALALVAARRYRARHTLSGAARPFAHPRRRDSATPRSNECPQGFLMLPIITWSHEVMRITCCWDRAREPCKPRELYFQPKPFV